MLFVITFASLPDLHVTVTEYVVSEATILYTEMIPVSLFIVRVSAEPYDKVHTITAEHKLAGSETTMVTRVYQLLSWVIANVV